MAQRKHPLPRKIGYWIEYLATRLISAVLGRLPLRWHCGIARFVGMLCYHLIPFRKSILEENLAHAFPEMPADERNRLIRRVYARAVEMALEVAWMRYVPLGRLLDAIEPDPEVLEIIDGMRSRGEQAVLATAHLGNWEMMLAWIGLRNEHVGTIYKPMHNPLTDKFVLEMRGRFGAQCFSTRSRRPREIIELIRKGGLLCLLADQDAGKRGVFVPFFGRPASTASGLATLCIRNDLPLIFGYCLRISPEKFRIGIYPPVSPQSGADRQAEELRLLTQYSEWCEHAVRQAPAQYFWWHKRWKTRPRP